MKKAKSIVLFVLVLSFTAIVFLITITYGFMTSDFRVDENLNSFFAQTFNGEISPQQFDFYVSRIMYKKRCYLGANTVFACLMSYEEAHVLVFKQQDSY